MSFTSASNVHDLEKFNRPLNNVSLKRDTSEYPRTMRPMSSYLSLNLKKNIFQKEEKIHFNTMKENHNREHNSYKYKPCFLLCNTGHFRAQISKKVFYILNPIKSHLFPIEWHISCKISEILAF